MPSTIERTDVSEPRSAPVTHQGGDASTSTGLETRRGRWRRRAVFGAVAGIAIAGAAAAIAVAVVDRSEHDRDTHSIPGLVEVPPLAEPWVAAGSADTVPVFVEAPPLAEPWVAAGSADTVPVFVEAPPLAEPWVAR